MKNQNFKFCTISNSIEILNDDDDVQYAKKVNDQKKRKVDIVRNQILYMYSIIPIGICDCSF